MRTSSPKLNKDVQFWACLRFIFARALYLHRTGSHFFMLSVMIRVSSSNLCISPVTLSPPFNISYELACTSTVTVLMFLMAVNTSLLPFSCSRIASVRRSLISFTCSARVKITLNFSSTVLDEAGVIGNIITHHQLPIANSLPCPFLLFYRSGGKGL